MKKRLVATAFAAALVVSVLSGFANTQTNEEAHRGVIPGSTVELS